MGRPRSNIIGNVYGDLTVIDYAGVDKGRNALYLCSCICGQTITANGQGLKRGITKNCGCIHNRHRQEMIGKKFGKLTVIGIIEKNKWGDTIYQCKCDCGKETNVAGGKLNTGWTKTCGCSIKEHQKKATEAAKLVTTTRGESRTHLYGIRKSMIARCNNPKTKFYENYGGRGIRVCKEWLNSYELFRDWAINNGYIDNSGLSIDRIDNDGDYTPSNCRWVGRKIQQQNRRVNRFITINNETKCLSEWAKIYGISVGAINLRIKKGMDEVTAIIQPVKKNKM